MDFDNVSFSATKSLASNETTNQENLYGSGIFFKQEYLSGENTVNEGDLRGLKVSKTIAFDDFSAPKALQKSSFLRSNSNNSHGSQMLCFSSPNSSQSVTFPFYNPSSNAMTAAYGSEYLNGGSMQGSKGYFTPSQWMELEHQALIYKYIHANVPVPSSLLIPIRKSLDSVRFSGFMGLKPSTFGLGAYQLGFSNSPDPEPGRCRRTDGKKWRCSKDAMSDHKYCERHTNRGRRRSRKPVEDQSGHSVTGTRTSTVKQMSLPMASSTSAAMVAGGAGSDSSRCYSIPKPQNANHESSSTGEFGQVWFDSLMNPFKKSSSEEETEGTISAKQQNGLHQFFTNWCNSDSKSSWQDMNMMNSERTQLSISIPSTNSDFMSSTSSPTNEKASSSLSNHSRNRREASWIPVNWESSSMGGGPLAEVLKNTNNNNSNNLVDDKAAPSLNLMMAGGGWDGNVSPYMASSPTGVLQKAAFLSSSNSSAGSSPRTNSICSNVFVSSLKNLLLPNL